MTVVMSEMSVLVSRPIGRHFDSPPKMEVRRRMKVDLPQPESAATPMTTAESSICTCDSWRARKRDAGRREVGAKPSGLVSMTV